MSKYKFALKTNCVKEMKDDELESWKRAVTCADGVWITYYNNYIDFIQTVRYYNHAVVVAYVHTCTSLLELLEALWKLVMLRSFVYVRTYIHYM